MRVQPNIACTALSIILLTGGIGAAQTAMAADPIQKTNPLCVKPTNDVAVEGRRAFMRMNCYSCHGATGHGGAMGPSLVGVETGDVSEAVLHGEGEGMPAFKNNLCAKDIANLTAYLQLLGTGTEPVFVNWWEPGPGFPVR